MSLHYFNYFNSSNFNNSKLFSDLYLTKFLDKNFLICKIFRFLYIIIKMICILKHANKRCSTDLEYTAIVIKNNRCTQGSNVQEDNLSISYATLHRWKHKFKGVFI